MWGFVLCSFGMATTILTVVDFNLMGDVDVENVCIATYCTMGLGRGCGKCWYSCLLCHGMG